MSERRVMMADFRKGDIVQNFYAGRRHLQTGQIFT